jgi:hypothetical protein
MTEICVDSGSYKAFAKATPITGDLVELNFYSIFDVAKDPTAARDLVKMYLDKDAVKKLSVMLDAVA